MSNAISWVFTVISMTVDWLSSWSYAGIPFLSFLIALAVIGIVLRYTL